MDGTKNISYLLNNITELSHEFGTTDYVRGGGGNTSVKDEDTVWVKPSGTTLSGLTPDSFIALDRKKLAHLYQITPPSDSAARESLVKDIMASAIKSGRNARPSVESPLHDSFTGRYVVHTHPALVNGMTCAAQGAKTCKELFADSLWIDYVDPGYTLCMHVRQCIEDYEKKHGHQPEVVFLQNHGVFVAGDSPQQIRNKYAEIMQALKEQYRKAGISTTLQIPKITSVEKTEAMKKKIREVFGQEKAAFIEVCGKIRIADGPISPDHIVYSKSYPFIGEPTEKGINRFINKHGYSPVIINWENLIFAIGANRNAVFLALELAKDGALVLQLTEAFGGITYMNRKATDFIENWEVEIYRKKQI